MSKAKNKEAYYFSHDSNARHDPKIVKMETVYPYGYGWYFKIVEILREQKDYRYRIDKYCWGAIAAELKIETSVLENFLKDCINEFELFATDGGSFWSDSLCKRMEKRNSLSKKRKMAGKNGGLKRAEKFSEKKNEEGVTHLETEISGDDFAIAKVKQKSSNGGSKCLPGKEKKRKEKKGKEIKENKENNFADFIPPELLEIEGFLEAWNSWLEERRRKRKPVTEKAAKLQFGDMIKYYHSGRGHPVAVLEQSIKQGWQGLFEIKNTGNTNGTNKSGSNASSFRGSSTGGFRIINEELEGQLNFKG